jgi:hypothetical protein
MPLINRSIRGTHRIKSDVDFRPGVTPRARAPDALGVGAATTTRSFRESAGGGSNGGILY